MSKSKSKPVAYDIDFCDYEKVEQTQIETEDENDEFSDNDSEISEPEKVLIEQDEIQLVEEFNNQYSFINKKKKKKNSIQIQKSEYNSTEKNELIEEDYLSDD